MKSCLVLIVKMSDLSTEDAGDQFDEDLLKAIRNSLEENATATTNSPDPPLPIIATNSMNSGKI